MAKVIKGKLKGELINLNQWCNDWATDSEGNVYNITNLIFSRREMDMIVAHKNNGIMFELFWLAPCSNGGGYRFKRKVIKC